jgi:uncharacterized protein
VTSQSGDRSSYFPAIERKHGQPVSHWLEQLAALGTNRYPDMMAFLREQHGFSQSHANALVQWARGSTSSQRFTSVSEYLDQLDPAKRSGVHAVISAITAAFPHLEVVMAWNQPMLRQGRDYVFGISVAANHLTLNPWSIEVLERFGDRLRDYTVNKHTFVVPLDAAVDANLLCDLVAARLAEVN